MFRILTCVALQRSAHGFENANAYAKAGPRRVYEVDRSEMANAQYLKERGKSRQYLTHARRLKMVSADCLRLVRDISLTTLQTNAAQEVGLDNLRREQRYNNKIIYELLGKNEELERTLSELGQKVSSLERPVSFLIDIAMFALTIHQQQELEGFRLQLNEERAELEEHRKSMEEKYRQQEYELTRREAQLEKMTCEAAERRRKHWTEAFARHPEEMDASGNSSPHAELPLPGTHAPTSSTSTHATPAKPRMFFKPQRSTNYRPYRTTVAPASVRSSAAPSRTLLIQI